MEPGSRLRADRPQPRSYSRGDGGATGKAGFRVCTGLVPMLSFEIKPQYR